MVSSLTSADVFQALKAYESAPALVYAGRGGGDRHVPRRFARATQPEIPFVNPSFAEEPAGESLE